MPPHLVVVLDAHADGVDEDGDHDAPAEVLALHDAPQLPPHVLPHLLALPEAVLPLSAAALVAAPLLWPRLFQRVLLVLLAVHRLPHVPLVLLQGAQGAVVRVARHRQADGVGQRLGAVVLLVLVRAVGGCNRKQSDGLEFETMFRPSVWLCVLSLAVCCTIHAAANCPSLSVHTSSHWMVAHL